MKLVNYIIGAALVAAASCPLFTEAQSMLSQTGIAQPCIGANAGERIRYVQTKSVDSNGVINQVNDNNGVFFNFAGNHVRINTVIPASFKFSHTDNAGNNVYMGCSNLNGQERQNNNDYLIVSPDRNHINRVMNYYNSGSTQVYQRQDTPATQGMIY